ncbi:MAG: PTS transporter subunit EIIC [Atopobiaceae bacterium]|nr:PTS transporter subunit EIIC [Atopobiaceae bacterium]
MTLDDVAGRLGQVGNEVHLRSLRDTFEMLSPVVVASSAVVLLGQAVMALAPGAPVAEAIWSWATRCVQVTMGLMGLLTCAAAAWTLAKAKGSDRPLEAVLVALACLCILATSADGSIAPEVMGPAGMVSGLVVGLGVAELLMRCAASKRLRISFGGNVPPAVGDALSGLLPLLVVLGVSGVLAAGACMVSPPGVVALMNAWLQVPLSAVLCNLVVVCVVYAAANLLFCHGLHQATLTGVLVKPLLIAAICQNMQQVCAGVAPTGIMNVSLMTTCAVIGGSGSTLCLLLATALFSHDTDARGAAKDALAPGLFNINEPVIFGYPVMGEPLLEVPFVAVPVVGLCLGYAATVAGVMPVAGVAVPWICPPVLSAFLSCGGSLAAVGVQLGIIIVWALVYLPFMVVRERRTATAAGAGGSADAA